MLLKPVNYIKDLFKPHYKILLLSVFMAAVSCPAFTLYYVTGIDGPLNWVFNYLADGHFEKGQYFLFPHGPLAFLLYPLPMGNNLIVALLVHFLISVFLSLSIYRIYFIKNSIQYLLPSLLILILLASLDIQLKLLALTISQFALFEVTEKKRFHFFAAFFCVLNLFIKSYGGIISILLCASVFIYKIVIQKNYKQSFKLIVYFIECFFLFWLVLYHNLSGCLYFLRGQFELATDNSEAVSFYQVNNWWWIGLCFIGILCIPFFTKDKLARFIYFCMLLPLFGAWKHAMSRGDDFHVSGFLSFLFLFCFMLWLFAEENNAGIISIGLFILTFFSMNLASTAVYNDYTPQKNIALFRPHNFINTLLYHDSLSFMNNKLSGILNQEQILNPEILSKINSATTDIFPFNHSVIAINNLNWVSRPTLHSYASYTHWLDKKNAEHYLSEKSAEFYIWQIDMLGGKLNGIDSRYLLNDAPQGTLTFFSKYSLVYKDSKYLLFEKSKVSYSPKVNWSSEKKSFLYEEWIEVPEHKKNTVTRAKLFISKSLTGLLKSAFYKGESFSIFYELSDGTTLTHKVVPKNAEDGLWINPMIVEPSNNGTEPEVKKIKIKCWDEKMVTETFELQFEEIQFEKDEDFLKRCFWK